MFAYMESKIIKVATLIVVGLVISSVQANGDAGSGTAVIIPSGDVIAGSSGTWTIRYTAVDTFINGVVEVTIPSGWSSPQTGDSSVAGYTTVSTDGVLDDPAITTAGRKITVHIAELDTNETVDIIYGDDSKNSLGVAIAQTNSEDNVVFQVASDPVGTSPSPISSSPSLNVIPADIAKLTFITPQRSVTAGEISDVLTIRTYDVYDNPAPVTGNKKIYLHTTSTTGEFSHLGGSSFSATDTVVIQNGGDTVSFYYRDQTSGTYTIAASAVAILPAII